MDKQPRTRMAGKYVSAFSWPDSIDQFIKQMIPESPLLHVCSGPNSDFGDVRVDRFVQPVRPAVVADWTKLPFAPNSFGAVFADPPWNIGYMEACKDFCVEAMRIAPVFYVMSPWLWVNRNCTREQIWVREFPGINQPILIVKYARRGRLI